MAHLLHQLPNGRTVPSWWTERGWGTDTTDQELLDQELLYSEWDIDDAPPTPPAPQDLATARNLVTVLMKSGGLSLALELIEDVMQSSTHAQYDYKMLNMQTEIELILAGAGLREWREQIALTRAKKVVKLAPKWAPGYYRLGILHSIRMQPTQSIHYLANAANLEPDNELYQIGVTKALADLPPNMKWDPDSRMIQVEPNESTSRNVVHPPQRAVKFAKEWYEQHGKNFFLADYLSDNIMYINPFDRPLTLISIFTISFIFSVKIYFRSHLSERGTKRQRYPGATFSHKIEFTKSLHNSSKQLFKTWN